MNIINTFVHSELFFYALIVLFIIVLVIFGIVVYMECRKLKTKEAQLGKEKKKESVSSKVAPTPVESPVKEETKVETIQVTETEVTI